MISSSRQNAERREYHVARLFEVESSLVESREQNMNIKEGNKEGTHKNKARITQSAVGAK